MTQLLTVAVKGGRGGPDPFPKTAITATDPNLNQTAKEKQSRENCTFLVQCLKKGGRGGGC